MTARGADYKRRKLDDYPTPPEVLDTLFDHVNFGVTIYDPACGKLDRVLEAAKRHHKRGTGSDIITGDDFLRISANVAADIVTNPPYGDRRGTLALRFIEHALVVTEPAHARVAMLLPIDFDSGKTRLHVFEHPAFALKLVLLDRIRWFNGQAGSTNHAWFIWDWRHFGPAIIKYARIEYGDHEPKKRRTRRARSPARHAGRRAHV
jgi:hypothetical protein